MASTPAPREWVEDSRVQNTAENTSFTEAYNPANYRLATRAQTEAASKSGASLPGLNLEGTVNDARAKPAPRPLDAAELQRAAEAIYKACKGLGTDEESIYAVLQGMRSQRDLEALAKLYKDKYGITLEQIFRDEMSGHELDKALNLLNKKDNDDGCNRAGRIHQALIEGNQIIGGRSRTNCEKDIRDTLASMNSKEIAELDRAYQQRYGKTLRDAIMGDGSVTGATRDAVEIYLKGADKRSPEMCMKLAEIALNSRNAAMFQEAMSVSSPEARKQFMQADGDKRMKAAFGTGRDYEHARDYAQDGTLTTASKVRANCKWFNDNEEGIEQALKEMSRSERTQYMQGRDLFQGRAVEGLSEEQKKAALARYQEIHSALSRAGDTAEVARWEDMIAVKGGSLISKLAAHKGFFKDSSMNEILGDIESMSQEDWSRLKKDANYRKELDKVLGDFLGGSELERARKALDDKQNCDSYDQAKTKKRSVEQIIDDNRGFFNDDEAAMLRAIENMSGDEQKRYRESAQFRKQVDDAVAKGLDTGAERDAARHMLDQILKGQKPTQDIITKLNMHSKAFDVNEAEVIRDLQKAFVDDPALREKINNPKNAEEKAYRAGFMQALHRALDADEFERYARPLLEKGHLSMELQQELNRGIFDDDEQGSYRDLVALAKRTDAQSVAEKQKIESDEAYRQKVLGHLSADERQVALNALRQGEMRPEDVIRSHMLGWGTGEQEIKEALKQLSPEQKAEVARTYAHKYGANLSADLMAELGGQDARDVKRELQQPPKTAQEAFDRARDEYYESRDGIGSALVDGMWNGTGYMSDAALSDFRASLSGASSEFRKLSPEEQKEYSERLRTNLDAFVKSKGAAADALVDATIMVAALGGSLYTGGLSLSLLAKTALAGAIFKLAVKPAAMGADYDWSSAQTVVDAVTGGIDAVSIVVGPAQLAQVLRLGQKCASTAAKKLIAEGAEQCVKAGMQDQVEKKMFQAIANAISNGDQAIHPKVIAKLARELAIEGGEQRLNQAMQVAFREAMEQESRSYLKRTLTQLAFNTTAGIMGGGASGMTRGFAEWDSAKSVNENMARVFESASIGAISGGGGAAVFTVGFKVLGATYRAGKNLLKGEVGPAAQFDMQVTRAGDGSAELRAQDNPHIAGVRRANGEHLEFSGDEPIKLKDGDVPLLRVDGEGRPIKRDGTEVTRALNDAQPTRIKTASEVSGAINARLQAEGRPLEPGHWYTIGRADAGMTDIRIDDAKVSAKHASIYVDANGRRFIYDHNSTNGVYINGQRIKSGEAVQFKDGDVVTLGSKRVLNVSEVVLPFRVTDRPLPEVKGRVGEPALKQSNDYAKNHRMSDRVMDGMHMAGADAEFRADGSYRAASARPAIVVDRQNDPVLRAVIKEARQRFGHLPPQERALALSKWVKEILTPPGWSGKDLDDWYDMFSAQNNGKRLLFGEMLRQGKGVCSQQALLLKVLGDEFTDMKVTLVRGHYGRIPDMTDLNHVWTEIEFAGGKRLVYDPRQRKLAVGYDQLPKHHPGIGRGAEAPPPFKVGDRIHHAGVDGWKVLEIKDGYAVLAAKNHRNESLSNINRLNGGRPLKIGDRYQIYRSNGAIDGGWQLVGKNADGSFAFTKEDAFIKRVALKDLQGPFAGRKLGHASGDSAERPANPERARTVSGANDGGIDFERPEFVVGPMKNVQELMDRLHEAADWSGDLSGKERLARRELDEIMGPGLRHKLMANHYVGDVHNVEHVKDMLHDADESVKAAYESYVAKRGRAGAVLEQIDKTFEERLKVLNRVLDEFADEHGLPKVALVRGNDLAPGQYGRFAPGMGDIQVRRELVLDGRQFPEAAKSLLHEFVHNEQDYLVIRMLADELNLGREASPENIEKLRKAYGDSGMSGTLLKRRAQQILEKRNGEPLTEPQLQRARKLKEGMVDLDGRNMGQDPSDKLHMYLGMLESNEQDTLMEFFFDDLVGVRRELGYDEGKSIEKARAIWARMKAGKGASDESQNLHDALFDLIYEPMADGKVRERDLYGEYRNRYHEQEAHGIEATAPDPPSRLTPEERLLRSILGPNGW